MKTNALLKLLERQVDIVSMIVKANNYITGAQSDLRIIKHESETDRDKYWWHQFTKAEDNLNNRIERNTAIKNRLIRYYLDIQERIIALQPTIELNTISEMDMATIVS